MLTTYTLMTADECVSKWAFESTKKFILVSKTKIRISHLKRAFPNKIFLSIHRFCSLYSQYLDFYNKLGYAFSGQITTGKLWEPTLYKQLIDLLFDHC